LLKLLKISAHNLNSKTGFYFQKDFSALLKPLSKSAHNKQSRVVFFDADNILHCDIAVAERRQVRDFIIKSQQTDLEVDLLSSQPHYEGLNS